MDITKIELERNLAQKKTILTELVAMYGFTAGDKVSSEISNNENLFFILNVINDTITYIGDKVHSLQENECLLYLPKDKTLEATAETILVFNKIDRLDITVNHFERGVPKGIYSYDNRCVDIQIPVFDNYGDMGIKLNISIDTLEYTSIVNIAIPDIIKLLDKSIVDFSSAKFNSSSCIILIDNPKDNDISIAEDGVNTPTISKEDLIKDSESFPTTKLKEKFGKKDEEY
jgi:hypothetical protein